MLLPGYTDNKDDLISLGQFIKGLKYMDKFEILPYHTMGIPKYESLGIDYPLKGIEPLSKEDAIKARNVVMEGIRDRLKEKK